MDRKDRKTLSREYKEGQRPMGVYRVRNKITGKALIGNSVNLLAILNRHRSELRMGGHRNRALQKDWTDFGADAFEFEELDRLHPSEETVLRSVKRPQGTGTVSVVLSD
jgi:hypothetical protein